MKSSSGRTNLRPPVGRLTFGGAARRRRRSSPDGASAIAGQPGHAICMITSRLAPALALAGLLSLALPAVARGAPSATGDFDGDGRADLAIGIPKDSVGGAPAAGAAVVMYSTRRGVVPGHDQVWTQDT